MRGSRKFSQAGEGGGGVQIPRRGLTENFSTWQKLSKDKSILYGNSRGGPDPLSDCPPIWICPWGYPGGI